MIVWLLATLYLYLRGRIVWTTSYAASVRQKLQITLVISFSLSKLASCCCLLLSGCLTSQQHATVSQGRTCEDNCSSCHTETEVADQTSYATQSQYADTGPTGPALTLYCRAPVRVATGAPILKVNGLTLSGKIPGRKSRSRTQICSSRDGHLND